MEYLSLAQALGFLSYALGLAAFYQKDDRRLKILMLVFNFNHLIHFLLLGSVVSAMSAFLSAIRTATAIYISSIWVAIGFIAISLGTGLWLADEWWQLFAVAGTVIGTYSVFMLKGIAMRIGFLIGALCWLTNNILVGSIGGTLLELTLLTVNSTTIFRLIRDEKRTIRECAQEA
ncbi:membrane protein [Vibrio ishigakensis]|uniref:Membrane protein n=1 Tax=Vibrio ishigakensis TaxID=1481914 RepID=A0A0B8P0A7_9VIBR|nr:YgjV family protein [Vibrio ishigakensis]GAM56768.1 membrane protein [Vibrio ishigakensis]